MKLTRTIEQIKEALALPDTSALSFSAEEVRIALAQQFYFGLDTALAAPATPLPVQPEQPASIPLGYQLVPIAIPPAMLARWTTPGARLAAELMYEEMLSAVPHPSHNAPNHGPSPLWWKIVSVLDEVAPGWVAEPGTGEQCAMDAIRKLAARPAPAAPLPELTDDEKLKRQNVQMMADCMDMVRTDLIEMGIIDKSVAPMFIPEAVANYCKRLAASPSPAPAQQQERQPMQILSDLEVMRLREVGAAWMSQDGRNALDDWLIAIQSPSVETAAPGASTEDGQ